MAFSKIGYFIFCFFVLLSCAHEENIPIKGDFSILVVGDNYNVPVRVRMINKIQGADTFMWEFPQGSYTSSDAPHPEEIVYTQVGTHTITLHTSNIDGEKKVFQKSFTIFDELTASFDWEQSGSSYAPLVLTMQNNSQGGLIYQWHFEGGTPEYSTEKNPQVVFNKGGDFKITLEVINNSQRQKTEKIIQVAPLLEVDFQWSNEYEHNSQAPVRIYLENLSKNATLGYHWQVSNGTFIQESTEENPSFLLSQAGEYTIKLTAQNDKQTLSAEKQIKVTPGNNLLTFTNIKLGIHSAHNIGSFFSSYLGRVLTSSEIDSETGKLIDFVFFGQNASFSYNVFISPDKAQTTVFEPITNATESYFINKQENTGQSLLTINDFNNLQAATGLTSIDVIGNQNQAPFNDTMNPRVVLFQTANGRKGAIKIKSFVNNGTQSYILADIKIQKVP
ncbi:MAG: PKD domain-containing protein [Capnocytophaga sp.]|nr:PKD domain-containing protein [Capnocytophaga sp.]